MAAAALDIISVLPAVRGRGEERGGGGADLVISTQLPETQKPSPKPSKDFCL